jgi:hypothetical protein
MESVILSGDLGDEGWGAGEEMRAPCVEWFEAASCVNGESGLTAATRQASLPGAEPAAPMISSVCASSARRLSGPFPCISVSL